MLDIIKNGVGYVKLTYPDSSIVMFKTTINTDLLLRMQIILPAGYLYNIDKKCFVPYTSECKIDVSADKFELEGVHEFANRFI